MTGNTNHISIITLNVNGLTHESKDIDLQIGLKERSNNLLPARDSSHRKRYPQTKGERWRKTYHAHGMSKKARVSVLISDNVDFKPKLVRRDKEGHYILLKGSINQQDITIIKSMC